MPAPLRLPTRTQATLGTDACGPSSGSTYSVYISGGVLSVGYGPFARGGAMGAITPLAPTATTCAPNAAAPPTVTAPWIVADGIPTGYRVRAPATSSASRVRCNTEVIAHMLADSTPL